MHGELLQWVGNYLQLGGLYIKHGVLTFQVKWYEAEIRYIDKRIAQLERQPVDLDAR